MSKSEMKRFKYQFAYDMALCNGKEGENLCLNCARKLSIEAWERQATFMEPPFNPQTKDCQYYIEYRKQGS